MNNLLRKKTNELQKKKKKGFTLVELIIVIAIIAILAAIAIPKFGEIRENSAKKTDVATAKNIATMIATDLANNDGLTGFSKTNTAVPQGILDKLDGEKQAKSAAHASDKAFHYSTDATGSITVLYADGSIIYPTS